MQVEFSITELKKKLGSKRYNYVDVVILETRYGLEVRACPTNQLLQLVIDSTYLGLIPAKKIGEPDSERYRANWEDIDKLIAKKEIIEKLNYRCRRFIEKLRELAYSDEKSVGTMP